MALVKTAQDYESPVRLIEATVAINDNRKRAMARKVINACDGSVRGKKIAVLGLTFKPNTDDMRDSPSLAIIQALQDNGAEVHAYDPEGVEAAKNLLSNVTFGKDAYEIATGADALVLVTEWDEFRALDFRNLASVMSSSILVDLRNVYPEEEVHRHGFTYHGVGRSGVAV
jgi:UDPglucose 6-dehydrogenase